MRIDPLRLVGPLVALLLFVLVVQQTMGALRASGAWSRRAHATAPPSPYARVERLLARADSLPAPDALRDPLAFARVAPPAPARKPVAKPPAPKPAPALPVLTSIVWAEGNPSATVRLEGRDITVRIGTLFGDFEVKNITREQVILDRGGQSLALRLPKKGD